MEKQIFENILRGLQAIDINSIKTWNKLHDKVVDAFSKNNVFGDFDDTIKITQSLCEKYNKFTQTNIAVTNWKKVLDDWANNGSLTESGDKPSILTKNSFILDYLIFVKPKSFVFDVIELNKVVEALKKHEMFISDYEQAFKFLGDLINARLDKKLIGEKKLNDALSSDTSLKLRKLVYKYNKTVADDLLIDDFLIRLEGNFDKAEAVYFQIFGKPVVLDKKFKSDLKSFIYEYVQTTESGDISNIELSDLVYDYTGNRITQDLIDKFSDAVSEADWEENKSIFSSALAKVSYDDVSRNIDTFIDIFISTFGDIAKYTEDFYGRLTKCVVNCINNED